MLLRPVKSCQVTITVTSDSKKRKQLDPRVVKTSEVQVTIPVSKKRKQLDPRVVKTSEVMSGNYHCHCQQEEETAGPTCC